MVVTCPKFHLTKSGGAEERVQRCADLSQNLPVFAVISYVPVYLVNG